MATPSVTIGHPSSGRHRLRAEAEDRRRSRRPTLVFFLVVALLGGGVAYGSSLWVVGLDGGSNGQAQSGTVSNLSISATATPAAGNLLYPGVSGDVVVTIANPNPFPVTVTAVDLPTNATYATGYTSSALSATQTGCLAATPSYVSWNYATGSSGSAHTLTTALTVGASGDANNPLTVTFTNDATMTTLSPAACENTYFSMPSLTGIAAVADSVTPTITPAIDAWTS
jgi:hypothetical protein